MSLKENDIYYENLQEQYAILKENIKEMEEMKDKMRAELEGANCFDYDLIKGTKTPVQ